MKRFYVFMLIMLFVVAFGCSRQYKLSGIKIVGLQSTKNIKNISRGTIMRERYVYAYPEFWGGYALAAEDPEGNIITEGVNWSLEDPDLGNLEGGQYDPWVQYFTPKKVGETTVTAYKDGVSDTARIVVYPGWGPNSNTFPGSRCGFNFAQGNFVNNEAEADIWWPGEGKLRFEYGYWTDINLIALIDNLDTLTAENKELIDGPFDYGFFTDADQLFLVRTREGAIYAAIVMATKLVYKPMPLIPAP